MIIEQLLLKKGKLLSCTSPVTYSYVKWTITGKRSTTDPYVQASELVLTGSGGDVVWDEFATVTNPNGSNPEGEEPLNLIDGTALTKWLDFNFSTNSQSVIIIDNNDVSFTFSDYYFITANDATWRDPVSWTLEGSNDGLNWELLSQINNATITETRFAATQTFCVCCQ